MFAAKTYDTPSLTSIDYYFFGVNILECSKWQEKGSLRKVHFVDHVIKEAFSPTKACCVDQGVDGEHDGPSDLVFCLETDSCTNEPPEHYMPECA